MTVLAPITPKLAKLIPRLATDKDGEIIATVRAIRRTLAGAGLDLHDLAHAIEDTEERAVYLEADPGEREPETWAELASWIVRNDGRRLEPREREFVANMARWLVLRGEPTRKQGKWLRRLYVKLGGAA